MWAREGTETERAAPRRQWTRSSGASPQTPAEPPSLMSLITPSRVLEGAEMLLDAQHRTCTRKGVKRCAARHKGAPTGLARVHDLLWIIKVWVMWQAWDTYLLEERYVGSRSAKGNPAKQDKSEEEILVSHDRRCCRSVLWQLDPIQEHC